MGRLSTYAELFKIKQTFLLVFSGVLGYLIAAQLAINPYTLFMFILASTFSVCGTTGLNMYYDKDIDALMYRTKQRPLPTKRLPYGEAYSVSLIFTSIGIGLGFLINQWVGFSILIGFLVDVLVYTIALKRRTPINIVLGAIAGGMPIFGGYVAFTGYVDEYALLLSVIVMLWAMLHIWYIAIYYLDDYRSAGVPMLPVVIGEKKTIFASFFGLLGIFLTTLYIWYTGFGGVLSLITSCVFTILISVFAVLFLRTNRKQYSRRAYKILSPYLGVYLLVLYLERVIPLLFG